MDEEPSSTVHTRRGLHLDLSATYHTRSRGRSISHVLSPVLPSISSPTSPLSPINSPTPGVPSTVNKARNELRKLLGHLLAKLKARPPAPSVYESIKADATKKEIYGLGAVVETVKSLSAVRLRPPKDSLDTNEKVNDEEDLGENDLDYSTDSTYSSMSQLRDVLILSAKQRWQIFEPTEAETIASQNTSLRRLRRNSRQPGQRNRSPSLNSGAQPPDLLIECINILASVISEDCRFKMSSSRVLRPPYSLQAVSLDVAQSLINTNRHDAKILSRIGFAVIPAFASFNSALHARLLAFFEGSIIRGMLEDLNSWQGLGGLPPEDATQEELPVTEKPVVAIQVEEVMDEFSPPAGQQGWLQWSSASTPTLPNFLSAVAPSQSLPIYHLSSLVPPLLVSVLEAIDPFDNDIKDIPKIYRLHSLLHTIVSMKRDAYLDILEVVAYHGPQTRRRALALLATFWPKALGHVVIGKSLPIFSLADSLPFQTPSVKLQYTSPSRDHPYAHEFIPWRFCRQGSSAALEYSITPNCCQSCCSQISGFGLLCPFCLIGIHLNCYDAPDGTFHGQYLSVSGKDQQCFFSFSNTLLPHKDMEPKFVSKAQHAFRTANLFTLALCLVCQKPLWGCVKQGMKCSACMQFAHPSCLSSTGSDALPSCSDFVLSASHVTIDWTVLRQTFVEHYREMLIKEDALPTKSYEDIAIFYNILWTQLCIFENGIVYKSIIVEQKNPKTASAKKNQVDEFELQYFVRLYEAFLPLGRLTTSNFLREYNEFSGNVSSNEHFILFDWSLLADITSILKAPLPSFTHPVPPPSNLLHVSDHEIENNVDPPSHPFELVPLSQMRQVLKLEFQVYSDCAARHMLSHISLIGFFDRTDLNDRLFEDAAIEVFCSFPLPSGLDLSTSVETLVVAIEACLRDIDITINEYGFLLLVRRFWPTGAASDYALTRLTKIVLSWILAEDDRLVIIARDHVALKVSLPGVRTASDISPWPSMSRNGSKKGINSGGEYVMCRKHLLVRHALPWLAAVHTLNIPLYTSCLYDHCADIADSSDTQLVVGSLFSSNIDSKLETDDVVPWGEAMLRSIIKLVQSNVTLSSLETILSRWFDNVTSRGTSYDSLIFKSLPRLFNHDGDPSRRTSTLNDAPFGPADSFQTDTWKTFDHVTSEGLGGLERSLSWLRVMAYSAVDISPQTLKKMFKLAHDLHASFRMAVSLLESTMISMWLKPFGSDGLDSVMMEVNDIWEEELLWRMQSTGEIDAVHNFLRYSLVTCLLVYGCDRQAIISLGLVLPEEVRNLQKRRRIARTSTVLAALEIDPKLVAILSRYVREGPDSVCALVAKFLNTLVSESALLESHEIDHFILVNADALSQCAWRFYDLSPQGLNDIRTSFLLRILVVDPQPFDALLRATLRTGGEWQVRFQAVTRLFRIVLDVTSPAFSVEGRQWRPNVTDVLNHFFRASWTDDHEEIRLAVDTWAHTLLPAHLEVISSCWNEHMSKSPISDRARLSSFLVQLHPHFPSWHLLSWETIVEVLLDDDYVQNNGEDEDGYAAAARLSVYGYPSSSAEPSTPSRADDPDAAALRVSLLLLSLQMIADGIAIDLMHLLKIKLILAKLIGFNSTLQPSASGRGFHVQLEPLDQFREISFSCINPLMRVLDSPHVLSLPPSSMGVTWNENPVLGLVGDVFIDVVCNIWSSTENVRTLPYSILRALLESMLLVVVKHDMNSAALKHFDELICIAVKTVTDLVAADSSYDIRHLCLSVMQAFMRDYPVLALRILGHQVVVLTRLASSLNFSSEDSLVVQTKDYLEAAFIQYELSGLFWLLSKQGRMSDEFFVMLRNVVHSANSETTVSGETLRDSIVRDTLSKVAANTNDRAIPDVLYNLEKYVSICHHQSFPEPLIQHIGLRLTAIARQIAESSSSTVHRSVQTFDPNPLLLMSAIIIQHNKAQSVDLLLHTETLLRASLVRFQVHAETLNRLLHVVSTMYRRSNSVDVGHAEPPVNHIAISVLEVLSDSLKGKSRVLPSTMATMLETIISLNSNQTVFVPTPIVTRAGVDAISYLTYPSYRETYGPAEFSASLAAAKFVLHASNHDSSLLAQYLAGNSRNPSPVRVWNLVALTALKCADSVASVNLLGFLPSFTLVYTNSLKGPLSGILSESMAPNVNHAFASVKLWMLISRSSHCRIDSTNETLDSDATERIVWNELWPSFEKLLLLSLSDGIQGEMPPLLTFLWGCVSDLMLFVRQARSVVALDTSSHVSILNKLRASSRGESAGSKFSRALRSISEPPTDLSFDVLVAQVTSDVLAAEKLQAIEAYRQSGADKRREYADKRRIEIRDH